MTPESVITMVQHALFTLTVVAAPPLLVALLVGLLVSIFQAATQINEMTLSFIPKLIAIFLVIVLAGPWMLTTMMDYTIRLYQSIPLAIG